MFNVSRSTSPHLKLRSGGSLAKQMAPQVAVQANRWCLWTIADTVNIGRASPRAQGCEEPMDTKIVLMSPRKSWWWTARALVRALTRKTSNLFCSEAVENRSMIQVPSKTNRRNILIRAVKTSFVQQNLLKIEQSIPCIPVVLLSSRRKIELTKDMTPQCVKYTFLMKHKQINYWVMT